MAEAVRYEHSGAVATLTLDQPANRNAMTPALLEGLAAGLERALGEADARVVVLAHTGPVFSAGADLKGSGSTVSGPGNDLAGVLEMILESPKPLLARIAGHCMGGGVGLAAACDLSVASVDARFAFSEVRVGVIPAVISVVCLPKLGRSRALELFLTGEPIGAARAAEVGLITQAVPAADLDQALDRVIAQVLRGGPTALAAAKRLVLDVPTMERHAAFEHASALSRELFASEEAVEGMAAFRERRQARWVPKEMGS